MIFISKGEIVISNKNIFNIEKDILIPEGITLLLGGNGSGKTIFLKTIVNLINNKSIKIQFDDKCYRENVNNVRMIFDSCYFKPSMSGIENLYYLNLFSDVHLKKTTIEKFYKDWNKADNNTKVEDYSLGMKKRLSITSALMYQPKYLILDEPFNGLDSDAEKKLYEVIKGYKKENWQEKTLIISSHDVSTSLDYANHILLINERFMRFYPNIVDDLTFREKINQIQHYKEEKIVLSDITEILKEGE